MRVIFIKKVQIGLFILQILFGLSLILVRNLPLTVYKDREYWEKTGAIVWEMNVKQKLVSLTFDDGPSPTFTGQILDLLALYHAKGTFFVIGRQAEKYPDLIAREYREGHEIGNHTYNHQEVNLMPEYELKKDLEKADRVIFGIINRNMKVFRPTSGFYNEKIVGVAKSLKYTVVIWTWGMDSRDWTQLNEKIIARKIIKTIRPGSIILFHDLGGDRTNTIEALKIILPALQEEGYQSITVSALLKYGKEESFY
jgi:peptidoglycan-N-acetylglucosamine deacetylase